MSAIPRPVQSGVSDSLARLGVEARITDVRPVAGGCINHGARVETADGSAFFLKWNAAAPPGMFEAESEGLQALARPGALRVPAPVVRGGGSGSPAWLLMEWIGAGSPAADHDETLGRGLAHLHREGAVDAETFGWERDNWIGSLDQENRPSPSWSEFWAERRLAPQLAEARSRGFLTGEEGATLDRLVEATPRALEGVPAQGPHLLHGDLWGGNTYPDSQGRPVLVDPAVYRGHGEVDLAMSQLFGGFGPAFYAAYDEVVPVPEAYHRVRRPLYQVYYLLVHVSLFGASYVGRTVAAAREVLEALG